MRCILSRACLLFIASLSCASALNASPVPQVTYTLQVDSGGSGTWSLYASDSLGDNAGLELWSVTLNNVVFPVAIDAPYLQYLDAGSNVRTLGFHTLETNTTNPIGSGQDIIGGSPAVYGFGQTAGTLTTPGGGTFITQRNPNYAALLLLAHGTYGGVAPSFTASTADDAALVFVSDTSTTATPATMAFVTQAPEPMCAVPLLLVAGVMRRRAR